MRGRYQATYLVGRWHDDTIAITNNMQPSNEHPVLILGAGINSAAVARELLLNGVPVCVVDANDIAYGATARSSRLIHGGLRYLEYGDFHLVRESLQERTRLRKLAPHFVKPFRLNIPVKSRFGGFFQAVARFLGVSRSKWFRRLSRRRTHHQQRGMWLVRIGLWMYDRFVFDPEFSNSQVVSIKDRMSLPVNSKEYRWLCSYSDSQMLFPERFTISMFEDARRLAEEKQIDFRIYTYCDIQRNGQTFELTSRYENHQTETIEPVLVINASGAWGDYTLRDLKIDSPQLFGGTRGSHCVITNDKLKSTISNEGIYAEADDGRPVFLLPFGDHVLVGTTDIPYAGRPEEAIATDEELDYLLSLVQKLFPLVEVTRENILLHYCGVRPLPVNVNQKAASVSRGHKVAMTSIQGIPVATLIGGKLTTCRAFAEHIVRKLAEQLGLLQPITSRDIPFPGGDFSDWEELDDNAESQERFCAQIAKSLDVRSEIVLTLWNLCGTDVITFMENHQTEANETIADTTIPRCYVQHVIEQEWVTNLDDLVERRLMLLFSAQLTRQTLEELASCLAEAEKLSADAIESGVQATIDRLVNVYGRSVQADS